MQYTSTLFTFKHAFIATVLGISLSFLYHTKMPTAAPKSDYEAACTVDCETMPSTQTIPSDIMDEWSRFEQFIAVRPEFKQYQSVHIRHMSARPRGDHTQLCMGLLYIAESEPKKESSTVCFALHKEVDFHFSVTPAQSEAGSVHYFGESYNEKSLGTQLHTLFSSYDEGLVRMALQAL